MKIAYITTISPNNKNSWSGTNYYVKKALEDLGCELYCIFGYNKYTFKGIFFKIISIIFRKKYQAIRSIEVSKGWANFVKKKLESNTDVVLSLSTIPVAFLDIDIPIYVYVDGIFEYMQEQGFQRLLNRNREAHYIEQEAIYRCSKLIVTSYNCKNSVIENYMIDNDKIKVIPLGANIDEIPRRDSVITYINNRRQDCCEILFVGVDEYRKGLDIVIDTLNNLVNEGVKVKLHIVGLRKIKLDLPSYAINHGFLNKNIIDDYSKLVSLYRRVHFLFVPSRAEAFGLVFCEAGAYGVPVISHDVGGISTIVESGINGFLFEVGSDISLFSSCIKTNFENIGKYKELSMSSYDRFISSFNWRIVGQKIVDEVNEHCKKK